MLVVISVLYEFVISVREREESEDDEIIASFFNTIECPSFQNLVVLFQSAKSNFVLSGVLKIHTVFVFSVLSSKYIEGATCSLY